MLLLLQRSCTGRLFATCPRSILRSPAVEDLIVVLADDLHLALLHCWRLVRLFGLRLLLALILAVAVTTGKEKSSSSSK